MRDRALPHLRLASQINAAQTWLEALDFERARDHAAQAVDAAYALRHADFQARATWVLRTAAYRQDTATEPQPDLVAAAFAVGTRRGALHAMTEAAIAWRIGHPSAVALAEQARTGFHASGVSAGALLARSLHAAASADPAAVSPDIRQEVLAIGVPEICLQAAALWPGLTLDRQTALESRVYRLDREGTALKGSVDPGAGRDAAGRGPPRMWRWRSSGFRSWSDRARWSCSCTRSARTSLLSACACRCAAWT